MVFDHLGISPEYSAPLALDQLIAKFGLTFPSTSDFSKFAQETYDESDPLGEPDKTLVGWLDHEEELFRHLEKLIISERLERGFSDAGGTNTDDFFDFALSTLNRRKSRAGLALQNHVERIFSAHGLLFKRDGVTEIRKRPDFLFPGQAEYHNQEFDAEKLVVLGVKRTCKDRWRQVLSEASRIRQKHLLTVEPAISKMQTAEMDAEKLQLVVPAPIHQSYRTSQQSWLMSVAEFITFVKDRQPARHGLL